MDETRGKEAPPAIGRESASQGSSSAGGAIGKSTLHEGGDPTEGTEGEPRPLPSSLRAELEAATGTGLGDVRVHDNAAGHATAANHDANAVAIGNDIHMGAGTFDPASRGGRELIAHEVAHVVQAKSTSPDAGVDAAEADARGFASGFGEGGASIAWTPSASVKPGTPMRSPRGAAPAEKREGFRSVFNAAKKANQPDVAWKYLKQNEALFLTAIAEQLKGIVPAASARLTWTPGGVAAKFRTALHAALAGNALFIKLPELVAPADPWRIIDQHRPLTEGTPGVSVDGRDPVGPLAFQQLAGRALAVEVLRVMNTSIARMAPRYVTQVDYLAPTAVTADDLVASHPMDRVTSHLLVDPEVVKSAAPAKTSAKTKNKDKKGPEDPKEFRAGLRFLNDYHWLGERDPSLWNWIEVRDPKDAQPEEVAASLFLDLAGAQHAYLITQSGPYFRVEPMFARRFHAAKAYEPRNGGPDQKHKNNGLDLAGSTLATDAAIAQASDERRVDKKGNALPPDWAHLRETLVRSKRQIDRAKDMLVGPKLWELVLPARGWVDKLEHFIAAIPDERLAQLTPVIEGQSSILFEAVGAITEVSGMGDAKVIAPVGDVLREYAIVIGESHLIDTARAHLTIARQARAELPLVLLEQSANDTGVAVKELGQSEMRKSGVEHEERKLEGDRERIAALRKQQATGQAIDPTVVAEVSSSLKLQAIEARFNSLDDQLSDLANAARDSTSGFFELFASAFDSNVRALPGVIYAVKEDLDNSVRAQHKLGVEAALRRPKAEQAHELSYVAGRTERNLEQFITRNKLRERMQKAIGIIERQQVRTAIATIVAQILVLIGAGIVGSMAGTMVAGAIRGAMIADAATASIGMLRTARVLGTAGGLVVDAGINAGVQLAVQGGDGKEAFVANLLGSAAVRAALAPLQKAAQAWGSASQEVSNLSVWQKAGRGGAIVAKQGAVLTTMMITGAATDYVVHRIYHSDKPPTEKQAVDWAVQGGSMAIAMFVGHWTNGFEQRLGNLAETAAHLKVRTAQLKKLSAQVEKAGNPDAALELLGKRQELLNEEAAILADGAKLAAGKVSPNLIETMRVANRGEAGAVRDQAFAQVPLRLAGLAPDDASGTLWTGSSEQIAVALHQAHRAGIDVHVRAHDSAAREWKLLYNHKELTILETKLVGQPRAANENPSPADQAQARRYADAARFMQEQWEAKVKLDIDGMDVVSVDHLQIGYAYAGVVNQATLPAAGKGLDNKLVVYKNKGALTGRGDQELGQPPNKFDGPGVRATDQAGKDSPWLKSNELDRALDIGRLETQTKAYRGEATELQTKDKATSDDPWLAADRKFRVRIVDQHGQSRWFYANHIDQAGGLGPGTTKYVDRVVDPAQRSAMMAGDHPMLLQGDDVDYVRKVKAGRVLVWGGAPTAAWAAEPVRAKPGGNATVMADSRPPTDWQRLFEDYNALKDLVATMDPVPQAFADRIAAMEQTIADAHSGASVPRNRKPGGTYEKSPKDGPQHHGNLQIEFGTPSKIEPTGDGRVAVTVGTGENARTSIYDQVVIAHGQDPARGPAAMLGKGASEVRDTLGTGAKPENKQYGEVPDGTIALKPIFGPMKDGRQEILGLESIEPPGISLKGAAYATKKLSPWIKKEHRAAFEAEVDAMTADGAVTRDYGGVSEDSRTVSSGVEVQRDRIPRANEVTTAGRMRLAGPEHVLELDLQDRSKWDDQVRTFIAANLRSAGKWVQVRRLDGGATKAVVYRVTVDGTDVGVFKLFDKSGDALNEQKTLEMLQAANLKTLKVVTGRGTVSLDPKTDFKGGAILMDMARGTTVKKMIEQLPPAGTPEREGQIADLAESVRRVAVGLAEMHQHFGDNRGNNPVMMTDEAKRSDADYFLSKAFKPGELSTRLKNVLGSNYDKVKDKVSTKMYEEFLSAKVPATLYHGDANAGNFALTDGNADLTMFDVDKTRWSVPGTDPKSMNSADLATVKGTRTGAADVARFLNSLETLFDPGTLSARELETLRNAFKSEYFEHYRVGANEQRVSKTEYEKAERWYKLEMEFSILKEVDPAGRKRILRLVGVEDN